MNWYRGNIAEAVAHSKEKNAIFVVYVEGKDETTQKLNNFINEQKIRDKLESEDFVAIKIESDSQSYMQFATIYQVVPVPSIFFIGKSGTPLEIGTGIIASSDELALKIEKVLAASGRNAPSMSASTSLIASEQAASQLLVEPSEHKPLSQSTSVQPSTSGLAKVHFDTEQQAKESNDIVCDGGVCYKRTENTSERITVGNPSITKVTTNIEANTDERLSEARKKLEQQRRERIEEEKQKEKEQELRRRREGKEMQNLQQWQREQELKELKENIRREKLEEQAARDRIRAQIAADRAERAQRFAVGMDSSTITSTNAATTGGMNEKSINNSTAPDNTRIQFRFATGENSTHVFNSKETLMKVREHVRTALIPGTGIKEFTLATTYPKQEFNAEHDIQTLLELGLFPSAVILIIGKENTTNPAALIARSGGLFNMLSTLVLAILSPVISIFGYFKNMATGGDGEVAGNEETNNVGTNKRLNEERDVHEAAKRRNLERFGVNGNNSSSTTPSTSTDAADNNEPKPYRRYGSSNIHRLTDNRKDSDDENATWNGNSTQQQ